MDLCLYHKLGWLNSISMHPVFRASNLGVILDTCLSRSNPISYSSQVLLILLSKWVLIPSSALYFYCQHSGPELDLNRLAHGSLRLFPNYTSSCLT